MGYPRKPLGGDETQECQTCFANLNPWDKVSRRKGKVYCGPACAQRAAQKENPRVKYLVGTCKKCGQEIRYILAGRTPGELKKRLEREEAFSCPGNHVELSGPLNYVKINWASIRSEPEAKIPTDNEWLREKLKTYEHVVETKDLNSVVDKVVGFGGGCCIVMRAGEQEYIDFVNAPSGKRYYLIGYKATSEDEQLAMERTPV